jgi:hypothetical protein
MDEKTYSVSVLSRLVQLERDRLFAFDAAIQGAWDNELRAHLERSRAEHAADLAELEEAVRAQKASPPETESLRGLRAESRVAAAVIGGDEDILWRLTRIESEGIDAYAQAAADERLSEPLRWRLGSKLEQERRHRGWMRKWLGEKWT